MNFVRLIPVFLSALAAAAHFRRSGNLLGVLVCLALAAMLSLRQWWAARLVQVALAVMALEWLRTLLVIIAERQQQQRSWTAAAVILICVAAFTAASSLVFLSKPLRQRYRLGPAEGTGDRQA